MLLGAAEAGGEVGGVTWRIGSLFSGGEVEAPDGWRIGALGNAVVEACAYVVGCAVVEAIDMRRAA